jgi:ribulose-phosphate 3-epimerase
MTDTARLRARLSGLSLGVFAADHGRLHAAAERAAAWGAAGLHFDVMDGVFVPAITGGPAFVAALNVGLPRDVHLMVEMPSRQVAAFAGAGADVITVHAEAPDAAEAIAAIRTVSQKQGRPIFAGLALMPDTEIDAASDLLDQGPDLILVLAVDPRRRAPPAIEPTLAKLAAIRARRFRVPPLFAFDGGVTLTTINAVAASAPDLVVSGSAVFAAPDPVAAFSRLASALDIAAASVAATAAGH